MTSQPPTNPDLDTIEARANAATPGPWGSHRDLAGTYTIQARPRSTRYGMETDGDIATLAAGRSDAESYANARFIAHARTDVEELVAEVRQLRARALTASEYNTAWHAVEGAAGEEGADPGTILHAVLDRLGIAWQDAAYPAAASEAAGAPVAAEQPAEAPEPHPAPERPSAGAQRDGEA